LKLRQDGKTRVRTRMEMYDFTEELLEDYKDKDIGLSSGIRFTSALQVTCRNETTML
jgi:hypothetical protein